MSQGNMSTAWHGSRNDNPLRRRYTRLVRMLKGRIPFDVRPGYRQATINGKQIARALVCAGVGKTALHVGNQESGLSEWLQSKGYTVTSIDIAQSSESIRVVDMNDVLPFPDHVFDLVWCSQVLEYVDDPKFAIRELNRVLKPQGEMLFIAPNSYWWFLRMLARVGLPLAESQHESPKHYFHIQNIKEMFPEADLYGFLPYLPFKVSISGRFLNLLSPTFIVHQEGELQHDVFNALPSGEEYEKIMRQSFAAQEDHKFYMHRKAEVLLTVIQEPQKSVLLDIGAGTGEMEELIAPRLQRIVGTDTSSLMLDYAKSKDIPNCTFISLEQISKLKKKSFDYALLINVLHHVTLDYERVNIFSIIKKYIKEDGKLIVFEHNPWNPYVWFRFNYISEIDRDAWMLSSRKLRKELREQGLFPSKPTYLQFYPKQLKALSSTEQFLSWLPLGGEYMVVAKREESKC